MSDRRNCLKGIEEVLKAVINAGTWYSSALEINQYEQPYNGEQLEEMLKQVLSDLRSEKKVVVDGDDYDLLLSFIPEWAKETRPGMDPTMYGTLRYEDDKKIVDRVKKILQRREEEDNNETG